jgi:hypothetical protein
VYTKVPLVPVGADTVTDVFDPVVVIIWLPPLLMLYVKEYGGMPTEHVKVISGAGELFRHTAVLPPIVAVNNGFTVTVAVCPVTVLLQF